MRLRLLRKQKQTSFVTKEDWDASYTSGRWDYLRRVDEIAHYSMIIAYCHVFGEGRGGNSRILDVGCGEGVLLEVLNPQSYVRYVGVDVSEVAIQRARPKQDTKTIFVREDGESYVPEEKFTAVVYNECLYYLKDPLALMKRHEAFLMPNGVYIVSMYVTTKNQVIWKLIGEEYSTEDEVRVDGYRRSWIIKALRPKPVNCTS